MRAHTVRSSSMAGLLAALLGLGSPIASAFTGPDAADQSASADPSTVAQAPSPVASTDSPTPGPDVPAPIPPRPAEPRGSLLVRVPRDMAVRANPSGGSRSVGTMPSGSKYYDEPITAWVEEVSPDGRWGRVEIPYVWPRRHGWIALRGLARRTTSVEVQVDLSEHRLTVTKLGRVVFGMPAATGAAASPTPPGEYFVSDRIAFSGGYLGTFAFGISGIQPSLPAGWTGGNQLAIHGTNDPSSIGRSASAGCLRVSERSLDRLQPLLQPGTPVIVSA